MSSETPYRAGRPSAMPPKTVFRGGAADYNRDMKDDPLSPLARQHGPPAGRGLEACVPGLLSASCLYLILPYLIFFAGWLRWWLAIPAAALVVASSYYCVRDLFGRAPGRGLDQGGDRARWHPLVLLLAVAVVLSVLSGAGGYGAQDSDHPKHNAILKSLVEEPWPVMVASPKGSFPMVYYVAYYLPAGLFGKATGWEGANHFLQVWTALGLALSMLWFCVLFGRLTWLAIVVFVFFSGLDVIGATLFRFLEFTGRPDFHWSTFDWSSIDWASLRWWNWQIRWWDPALLRNYSSNMALVFFVPQQALGGWILTGMVCYLLRQNGDWAKRSLVFYWALSCLWSPLVTIGLAPLLALDFAESRASLLERLKAYGSLANLCGLAILGILGLYYLARFADLPFEGDPSTGFGLGNPRMGSPMLFLVRVLLFFTLEVGILAWLVWDAASADDPRGRRLFRVSLGFLFLLPFFRYGGINDLVMRASIPCLFVFAVYVARALARKETGRTKRLALMAVVAVAAANPVAEIYRHAREVHRRGKLVLVPQENEVDTLWSLNQQVRRFALRSDHVLFQTFRSDTFFLQYIGSPDSFFFRWLARKPDSTVSAAELRMPSPPSGGHARKNSEPPSKTRRVWPGHPSVQVFGGTNGLKGPAFVHPWGLR